MSYRTARLSPTPPSRSLLLKPSGPFRLLPRSEHPPGPRPVRALHPLPGRPFPGPLLSSTAPSQRGPPRPPPGETPRRRHLMPAPGLTPRGRTRAPRVLRACLCLFPGRPAPARVSAAEGRTRRPGAMPGTPRALRDHVPKGHATSPTAQAPEGPSSSWCHLAGSRPRLPGADSPPGASPIHPWGPSSSRPLRSVYREGRR